MTEGPDLANGGPSITARRVAAYRLGFARVPAPYGDAAADQTLAADVAAGQEPAAGRMREYLEARTRFFDRVVIGAIDRGVRQIVVGAAGYDGRALRYARSGVRWFEVDHPATQRDKRDRLARLGLDAGQVRFVEANFTRDPIAERLTAAGLNPGRLSLFLLEGVAVYLEPASRPRTGPHRVPPGRTGRQPPGDQRVGVRRPERGPVPLPGLGRHLGRAGQVHPRSRPGHRGPRPHGLAGHRRRQRRWFRCRPA